MISVSVVHWYMANNGWTFQPGDGVVEDSINGAQYMHQIYTAAMPDYSGRVTVPVLWDKQNDTIVSNEAPEIIRMLNSAFDDVGAKPGDYYPNALRSEIDDLNERIYESVNNGVYKCGFATTQEAYEEAITPLFETLDWLDDRLSSQRFLTGNTITEADWRLFTTLGIVDYPNLSGYVRDLYQQPGVSETVNMQHIKHHYYASHESVNPSRVVPAGPEIDFMAAHDRAELSD